MQLGGGWRTSPVASSRERGLNVLLITIDTLRADAVGVYGQPGGITPVIDRLAAAGLRFDDAHAHNVVTLPSHANILSGRLPPDHGVRDNAGFRFPAAPETIATLLKAQGYRTAAFVSAFPLESRFGLARGFDLYDDRFADAAPRPTFLVQERRGTETVALARQWIEAAGGNPWFCWLHLYEPHFPYEPDPAFATRFPNRPYYGEVAAADAALAPVVEPLLAAGRDGRTLVVLTSDHGEALGDHGEATHGVFAYEAALRVPLIVYQPRLFAPAIVTTPAGHVDLLPTVLDALSLPMPDGLAGKSLLVSEPKTGFITDVAAALRRPKGRVKPAPTGYETNPTYFEAMSASFNRRWAPLAGVIRDRTKYIDLPIPELYDLRADPGETRNLAQAEPERLEDMRRLLAHFRTSDRGAAPAPESAETRERLRSLGYAAGRAGAPSSAHGEEDDPKRLIALDAVLQELVALYLEGRVQSAVAKARDLVRLRPQMPLALLHLAILEREAGNMPAAIDALRSAVALNPEDSEAVSLLGAYLTQAGRPREAAELLEPYAKRPDAAPEVLTSRALALARAGRAHDALVTLETARARDASNAMTLVEIGTVHLMANERDRAREAFRSALAVNPNVARAHSSLGVLAVEDGHLEQAFEHWRSATSLDPREHEKILGLGISLARAGRLTEARACFEFFVSSAPHDRYGADLERAREWLKKNP